MDETLKMLRSFKIAKFAIFDFTAAFAGMYYVAPYLKLSRQRALWLTIPIGVVTHKIIGIDTPLNKMLLGTEPNRIAQILVLGLLYKGLTVP